MKNKDGLEPYHYAYLMNQPIQSIYEISEDLERDTLDLREIVSNFVLREENVINSMISKKNQKLRVWTAVDFNSKIVNLMNSKLEEIKENENENEEEQNNNENNKENTAQNDNNQNAN